MSIYFIQSETMEALGDEIRRLSGQSGLMSPAQMIATAQTISVSGSGGNPNALKDEIQYIDSSENDGIITIVPPLCTNNLAIPLTNSLYTLVSISLPLYDGDVSSDLPYSPSEYFGNVTYISLPSLTSDSGIEMCSGLSSLETAIFTSLSSLETYFFSGCSALTEVHLLSSCNISNDAFYNVLDPDNKTLKIYFHGQSVGTCDTNAFGSETDSGDASESESAYDGPSESGNYIPGLEIYVPSSLINDFKTSWANGSFADNIYSLPASME